MCQNDFPFFSPLPRPMTGPISIKQGDWKFVEVDETNDTILGRGAFGDVFLGKRRAYSGRNRKWPEGDLAVKRPRKALSSDKDRESFWIEMELMCRINHPACLSLFAWDCNFAEGVYGFATPLMHSSLDKVLERQSRGVAPSECTPTRTFLRCFGHCRGCGLPSLSKHYPPGPQTRSRPPRQSASPQGGGFRFVEIGFS
jgi:serine/threonine protein kinase